MDFVANFIRFPAVQKVRKLVKIWQSYREYQGGNFFFETQCIFHKCWVSHTVGEQQQQQQPQVDAMTMLVHTLS